ncbi:MAG: type II CAAX endopeptidase family protein [Luteolibacter sp.]
MSDPTEIVLTTSYITALGLFAAAAIGRKLLVRKTLDDTPVEAVSESEDSPYRSPLSNDLPPPLSGKVPVWFYQPFDLLGIGMIYLVFFALVIASVRSAQKADLVLDPKALLISIGFQFAIAGTVAFIVTRRASMVEWLGLRWQSWPWVFLIAPATVALMWLFFGTLQASGYMKWMESLGVESVQDTVKLLQTSKDPLILGLMAFAAVLAAPVCEEIVFRGYFYPAAKKFAGPWAAGIFSALVFASAHGSLSALLPLFIFGCVLAFIYEKTGSLWAPIAVHFCFNGATVLVQIAARVYHLPLDSVQ